MNDSSTSLSTRRRVYSQQRSARSFSTSASMTCLRTTFALSPIVIISFFIALVSYILSTSDTNLQSSQGNILLSRKVDTNTTLSLCELATVVAQAFEDYQITYWLMPNNMILQDEQSDRDEDDDNMLHGKVLPWSEGLDFGVNQTNLMQVLLAQSELQRVYGIVAVESYFGLRLFQMSGHHDERYDFHTPFIDVFYFQTIMKASIDDHIVNYCCDCESVDVGICMKKACGCLICAMHVADLYPMKHLKVRNIQTILPIINQFEYYKL